MGVEDASLETHQQSMYVTDTLRRGAICVVMILIALQFVPAAAAHDGLVHAGTPHWLLLASTILGGSILVSSLYKAEHGWGDEPRRSLTGIFIGLTFAILSIVGLVEIQVEPTNPFVLFRDWYSEIAFVTGTGIMLGSVVTGLRRWPQRPLYTLLGALLGIWVAYPVVIPGVAIQHPLGYVLVPLLPLLLGYILWRDVIPSMKNTDGLARRVGVAGGSLFTVFFLVSSGLLSFNPEGGVHMPTEPFVTIEQFASPLVLWPAVEFYLPSIPVFGAMSVGTAIIVLVLSGLVSINAVLATTVWQHDLSLSSSNGVAGAIATTGATTCCCCGPALYGLASALFGAAASPVYWALLDPSSPFGMLFFVGAVALLTGSNLQLTRALDDTGMCTSSA